MVPGRKAPELSTWTYVANNVSLSWYELGPGNSVFRNSIIQQHVACKSDLYILYQYCAEEERGIACRL
jgi:hypothetical protein